MTSRAKLDQLLATSDAAVRAMLAIADCFSPEWRAAHQTATRACLATERERARLFAVDPWGTWMSPADKALARITGRL